MNLLSKKKRELIYAIFSSIYFNFHYLPFRQAILLPILLYKPCYLRLKGRVIINADNISFGMIRLGFNMVSLYPSTGIVWENHGGNCIFYGHCYIGNASAISIGKTGIVSFGKDFTATAAFKLASYYNIEFKDNVLVGWENTFIDTDFHQLKSIVGENLKSYASIRIGCNNWFAFKSIILKGTETADHCIVGANSLLNKKYEIPKYSLLGGNPAKLLKTGIIRKQGDDIIKYSIIR